MKNESNLININCPVCGNPIVTAYKDKDVKGELLHKCGQCKRYWDLDYTNKSAKWVKGKENSTPVRYFTLDLSTGNCSPMCV
jgi:C4-type Zn-finger protein